MNTGGPYLNAGVICERVLQERDGVLSLIRIIDRVTLTVSALPGSSAPETLPPSMIGFTVAVVLKSGLFKGTAPIKLIVYSPSNETIAQTITDVFFEGDDRGMNLVSPLQLQVQEDGLYWVEVLCGDQILTRIPFRVIYQRISQGALPWQKG